MDLQKELDSILEKCRRDLGDMWDRKYYYDDAGKAISPINCGELIEVNGEYIPAE
jgi:hypothetical protein